jgi:hypothetical protein
MDEDQMQQRSDERQASVLGGLDVGRMIGMIGPMKGLIGGRGGKGRRHRRFPDRKTPRWGRGRPLRRARQR